MNQNKYTDSLSKATKNDTTRLAYLHSDFIVCVSFIADAMCDWINDVDFQKICRSRVCVVQRLFFAHESFGGIFVRHFVSENEILTEGMGILK